MPAGTDVVDTGEHADAVLRTLVDEVCAALQSDEFETAVTAAKQLDFAVRQRVDALAEHEPVPANLLSILQYVSDRQQYAHALSSSKKREVAKAIREHRRGADGVSSYLDHAR